MPSTTKRPGVEAGINLASLRSAAVWERIESHGPEVTAGIPHLAEHEAALRAIMAAAPPDGTVKPHFTKSELDQVVMWKHTVGKNRIYNVKVERNNTRVRMRRPFALSLSPFRSHALSPLPPPVLCCALALSLVKYLAANSEEAVKRHSKSAIDLAMNVDAGECLEEDGSLSAAGRAAMQEAIGELGKLKGVGPATASAVLSLVRPDVFCFLYDEAIDTFEKTRQEPKFAWPWPLSQCLIFIFVLSCPVPNTRPVPQKSGTTRCRTT
jgi:hypothetical protein